MSKSTIAYRDTASWVLQVWASFALSVFACGYGVCNIPGQSLDRAFLLIGLVFTLFAAFALAKTIRDNRDRRVDTGPWVFMVWSGFAAAVGLTAWGLLRMPMGDWEKGYMLVAWLFLMSTVFTLAKTVRDKHDADQGEANPQTLMQ
ncbi:MAG: hypothetical protein JO142_06675 [Burkholderiales bacterium]|nr:hypothetical protein [Burkholderiales bacterium]